MVNMLYHGYHNTNSTPEFNEWYNYAYVAYGKNKGLYCRYEKGTDSNGNGMYEDGEVITTKLTKTAPDGTVTELPVDSRVNTDYIIDCNTKAEYDEAYRFYHNQKARGEYEIDLSQKAQEIEHACGEREIYYRQYMDKLISQYGSVSEIYANCDDEMYNYLIVTSSDSTGFNGIVESQEQVDKIVAAWANKYNNGEMPSWYYSTVYSDWAEWSGADLGYNTDSYYEFRGLN